MVRDAAFISVLILDGHKRVKGGGYKPEGALALHFLPSLRLGPTCGLLPAVVGAGGEQPRLFIVASTDA